MLNLALAASIVSVAMTLDVQQLQAERDQTLAAFHDPRRSPLAAVQRVDLPVGKLVRFGGAKDDDVQLAGLPPHAAEIRAVASGFERGAEKLQPGAIVALGRFSLRLSHQNHPAAVILDAENPALRTGPFPRWFPPDPSARVEAVLAEEAPREETIQSTRGELRRALRLGRLRFHYQGHELQLTALRLLEPSAGEPGVSIFFRDATTGNESYPVGRYVDAEPLGGGRFALDFNRAYNPSCAFSELYNCPIPPRENVLAVPVRAGERNPH